MKIGELARRGGTTTKTIRFYEQAGVLPAPARTPSRLPRLRTGVRRPTRVRPTRPGRRTVTPRGASGAGDRRPRRYAVRTCREHLAGSTRSGAGHAGRAVQPGNPSRRRCSTMPAPPSRSRRPGCAGSWKATWPAQTPLAARMGRRRLLSRYVDSRRSTSASHDEDSSKVVVADYHPTVARPRQQRRDQPTAHADQANGDDRRSTAPTVLHRG